MFELNDGSSFANALLEVHGERHPSRTEAGARVVARRESRGVSVPARRREVERFGSCPPRQRLLFQLAGLIGPIFPSCHSSFVIEPDFGKREHICRESRKRAALRKTGGPRRLRRMPSAVEWNVVAMVTPSAYCPVFSL